MHSLLCVYLSRLVQRVSFAKDNRIDSEDGDSADVSVDDYDKEEIIRLTGFALMANVVAVESTVRR